jgi:hypothetical protein
MKKSLLFVLLFFAAIAVKAQETITVSFHNNGNGTLSYNVQLQDRWPAGYLAANFCWCSINVFEVLSNGTEVMLDVPAGSNYLFKTNDVVNGITDKVNLSSGASTSKYYIQMWHYHPWNIPAAYMIQSTNTTPKAAI